MRQVPTRNSFKNGFHSFFVFLFGLFTVAAPAFATNPPLYFDFPEIHIASVENPKGPTGVTLFYFPKGVQAAVDIRGGSVGTFFTQEKMHQGEALLDGVAFAGGGILGLEAVSGIVSALFARQQTVEFKKMPLISGAVIFDYRPRKNKIYPDKALGEVALKNVKPGIFYQGRHGAGVSATVGKLMHSEFSPSGQGGAYQQIGDTKIAVFTVVNAVGVILNDKGQITYGVSSPITMDNLHQKVASSLKKEEKVTTYAGNTTLTLVVTNQKLAPRHLQQLGRQVHQALSQVIYPYASILDGDVLYTVSTGSVESDLYMPGANLEADLNPKLIYLGMLASELAKKAVWAAVSDEISS